MNTPIPRPLSVVLTTFQEAHHIQAVLASVPAWATDILVVDSYSTDGTPDLARQDPRVRLLQRAYTGPADQKNWAIPQAAHEWVLLLDADERVTPALAEELAHWLQQPDIPYDAFWIGRQNHFMGRPVRYSGWQNDAVVRFFHRDRCRYNHLQVHEEIETRHLRTGRLHAKLLHFTFKDMDHFLAKMQRYAAWSAQDHAARTRRVTWFHLAAKPAFRFFKHFVLQRGFLDGRTGFIVSVVMAWGVFLRYVKMREVE